MWQNTPNSQFPSCLLSSKRNKDTFKSVHVTCEWQIKRHSWPWVWKGVIKGHQWLFKQYDHADACLKIFITPLILLFQLGTSYAQQMCTWDLFGQNLSQGEKKLSLPGEFSHWNYRNQQSKYYMQYVYHLSAQCATLEWVITYVCLLFWAAVKRSDRLLYTIQC